MPSRAEWRRGFEWTCRAGALALLAWALWAAIGGSRRVVGGRAIATTLNATDAAEATDAPDAPDATDATRQFAGWARDRALAHLHVELDAAPDARTRDWLRALDAAGTDVAWSGSVPATAIAAEPVADPRGATRVTVAAPTGSAIIVRDAIGRLDSLEAAEGGATLRVASAAGTLSATVNGTVARTGAAGARDAREIVVVARAGWEGKFIAAALEEHGWPVTVRLRVAPGVNVGAPLSLDTANVSAVVAVDSTAAADAQAITAYVRNGGGLLLGPEAARLPAFAAVAPARMGEPVRAAASFAAAIAPVTRQTLAYAPLVGLRADAIPLERRDDAIVVAARRVDAGRVVQVGYDETWRWRMAGPEESPDAHRVWWSQLVESIAYAPMADDSAASPRSDPAPRAALVAAIGDSAAPPANASMPPAFDPSRSIVVYLAIAALLLVEWGSRRVRGQR